MRYSFSKEPITPDWPVRMAGYSSRTSKSTGVYDELYTRSLVLDDGERKVLIISIDICMIDSSFVSKIKEIIEKRFGFKSKDIIIHTIHTHAGPVSMLRNNMPSQEVIDDTFRFRKHLEDKILKNVEKCLITSTEGYMEFGMGETYIGMSRRQSTPNGIKIGPNPKEEIDRKTFVMTINDIQGNVKVVLFNCPCHPVVLYPRNLYISADFPGVATKEIEKKFPGAEGMFLQGAGADINPAILVADEDYRDTFYSDVIFTGSILANDVYNIICRGMRCVELSLETFLKRVPFSLSSDRSEESNYEDLNSEKCKMQITALKLSNDIRIICLDGEVCNQVGVNIRNLFEDENTIVLGYTNGYIGYIPTPKILHEGGYETISNIFKTPFAEDTEKILLDGVKILKNSFTK